MKTNLPNLRFILCLFILTALCLPGEVFGSLNPAQKLLQASVYRAHHHSHTAVHPNRSGTTSYRVDSINYTPYPTTAATTLVLQQDDIWSTPINIGFNFDFYGSSYSQFVIGGNGQISFDLSNAGSTDSWPLTGFPNGLPDPALYVNTIDAVYRDIDCSCGGRISYQLFGTSPNQYFVISWDTIPLYDGSCLGLYPQCSNHPSTFQIVLYEGCNAIEIHIGNSSSCPDPFNGWNDGLGIIGIQDATGTTATTPPGRNNTAFTAVNESWRFSYAYGPCAPFNAGVDQTICRHNTLNMAGGGSGTWTASLSNPSPTVISNPTDPATPISGFDSSGIYSFLYTDSASSDTMLVYVSDKLNSGFICDSITCTNSLSSQNYIQIRDTSQGAVHHFWSISPSLGASNASPGDVPTFSTEFTTQGTATIQMITTDMVGGCRDTAYQSVRIADPIADYNLPNLSDTFAACPPLVINPFIDASSNDIGSYLWDFGDGSLQDTSQNPSHIYTAPGVYTVTETVTSHHGCVDVSSRYNITILGPTVTMTASVPAGVPCSSVTYYLSSYGADSISFISGNGNPLFINYKIQNPGTALAPHLDTLSATYCQVGDILPQVIVFSGSTCISSYNNLQPIPIDTPTTHFISYIDCSTDTVYFADYTSYTAAHAHTVSRLWDFGDGTTDTSAYTSHYYLSAGTHTVRLTVGSNTGATGSYSDSASSRCPNLDVWPGDADRDFMVTNWDIFTIGLIYDSTGPARQSASIVWQAQPAQDWSGYFNPNLNYKHADCNGDGTVNADDTLAIVQNYNLTHTKNNSTDPWRSNTPAILAVPSRDSILANDTFSVRFIIGDSSLTVSNLYAVAFTYNFDPQIIDPTYTSMHYIDNSWITNSNSDKISLTKIFDNTGQIQTGFTRIDHTSRSGHGVIAEARFRVITSNLSGASPYYYRNIGFVSGVKAIDELGANVNLNGSIDTNFIAYSPNGIMEIGQEKITTHPNPANKTVTINAANAINNLSIINIQGQEVYISNPVNQKTFTIDISGLDNGIYFVKVRTAKGEGVSKITIMK